MQHRSVECQRYRCLRALPTSHCDESLVRAKPTVIGPTVKDPKVTRLHVLMGRTFYMYFLIISLCRFCPRHFESTPIKHQTSLIYLQPLRLPPWRPTRACATTIPPPVELDSTQSNDTVHIQPKYARGRFACAVRRLQPQDLNAKFCLTPHATPLV